MAGNETNGFDVIVIGGGPAGQKAAIQAVKGGKTCALVERESQIGGECVRRGTIPSKTLRESAAAIGRLRRVANIVDPSVGAGTEIVRLMERLEHVVGAHMDYMSEQIARNGVTIFNGRASFVDPTHVEVENLQGDKTKLEGGIIVVASGSRPRDPDNVPIDHEHILDSDSILSLTYLPSSLTILGGGVIACEYASIFSLLGVKVTLLDRVDRPLKFIDHELVQRFVGTLEKNGGRFVGNQTLKSVAFDGLSQVEVKTEEGLCIQSDKVLVALGRVAAVEGLNLQNAGLAPNARGVIETDDNCRTVVPHIYAVGDVMGPPSLASAAMEQGRRAICHALGLAPGIATHMIPAGIYTLPEMSAIGLTKAEADKQGIPVIEGRANFDQVARGQISGIDDGLLKLVCDANGRKILGIHIVGDGATELVHVGQMAMLANFDVDTFVENIFNFPTLAEAYRVAALDVTEKRGALTAPAQSIAS